MVLTMYFEKAGIDTDEDHGEFAEAALDQYTFLYGNVAETPDGVVCHDNVNVLLANSSF